MSLRDLAIDQPTRRSLLLGATALTAASILAPVAGMADGEAIDLEWDDLLPSQGGTARRTLREIGIVGHADLATGFEQPTAVGVTTEYDGEVVRLPGFVVPIDYDGTGVVAFILVPYVGACVHVPPPPANQLVLVTTDRPYEVEDMWEPVLVTGLFSTSATSTGLADVGYALSADRIEPYEG